MRGSCAVLVCCLLQGLNAAYYQQGRKTFFFLLFSSVFFPSFITFSLQFIQQYLKTINKNYKKKGITFLSSFFSRFPSQIIAYGNDISDFQKHEESQTTTTGKT